jgi:hypothetical protein
LDDKEFLEEKEVGEKRKAKTTREVVQLKKMGGGGGGVAFMGSSGVTRSTACGGWDLRSIGPPRLLKVP